MWVTPEDIAAEQFTHRRVRGGYDEAEVDDFLDLVARNVGDMLDRIEQLEAELHAYRARERHQARARRMPDPRATGEGGIWDLPAGSSGGHPEHAAAVPGPLVADMEAAPAGPYPELAPDRLDVTNGGRPHSVPRPGAATTHDGRQMAGASPEGQESPAWPGHPITSWQLPAFVPERTLADEIAEDAERYLHDEHRRAEARKESSTWRTAMELERAEWCRRVGLDLDPIEWGTG